MDSGNGNPDEGRVGHGDSDSSSGSSSGQRISECTTEQSPPLESLDLNDIEVELLEALYDKLYQARHDLSIAYTAALAARGHKGKQVTNTDLKRKKLFFTTNAKS
jgi:hypothetical protein